MLTFDSEGKRGENSIFLLLSPSSYEKEEEVLVPQSNSCAL